MRAIACACGQALAAVLDDGRIIIEGDWSREHWPEGRAVAERFTPFRLDTEDYYRRNWKRHDSGQGPRHRKPEDWIEVPEETEVECRCGAHNRLQP